MRRAAIGLGSSLGDRRAHLELAVRRLAHTPGLRALRCSRWYRTPPMRGGTARNWFLNGVLLLETPLEALELLAVCRAEEQRAGRRRANHWGDRTLDLDLLLVEGTVSTGPELVLPHPGVLTRDFVRRPLLDVWPEAAHPVLDGRIADMASPPPPRAIDVGAPARSALPTPG
ncbi:MAG: 2-amino-4-hydroxy-6-hydroxymethyldihydropteridine diphosphokinase [Alphaproteobacteria bacterium]|nr:2-amino-4-hydroxy-6-hydroxymethyldihydropteridine diphosphokinase [Alphaproteobacteria bacterium]MCB9690702.1 2-amino-4-hydroxy-6-hydroxymethyldihydropteridine diphosphokinase [Alphaproteobacteria bacterium]